MKLTTRRTIRRWVLGLPDSTPFLAGAASIGMVVLGILTEEYGVVLIGALSYLAVGYFGSEVPYDACQNCGSSVHVMDDRYCETCGHRLDELEAAPPIDERVDERHRPVGLEEIERSPDVEAAADGGEYEGKR